MEPLSILNPPVIDILNDPRVTTEALRKMIDDQEEAVTKRVAEWASQVRPEDIKPFDAMMFAVLQHNMHNTALIAKLTSGSMDLAYKTLQLNLTLERLTKWLIRLTIVLGVLTIPLAFEAILKWLK